MRRAKAIAFTLCSVASVIYGQVRPKKAQPPTVKAQVQASKPRQPAYMTTPFDPTVTLGTKVVGHDVEAVFKALQSFNQAKKGEFETTMDYRERLQKFLILSPQLTAEDTLAFVVKVDSRYDADSQLLTVDRSDHIGWASGGSRGNIGLGLRLRLDLDEKRMMQNGFGARVEVHDRGYTQEIITFDGARFGIREKIHAEISLAPDAAKAAKPALAILVYGKALSAVDGLYEPGGDASISKPEQVSILQHQMAFEPEGIWIINQETGVVLSKISRKVP